MKCPECQKEGKTSRVYVGATSSTLMGFAPYYDEEGNHHHNDPNIRTTEYRCSNGHRWQRREGGIGKE